MKLYAIALLALAPLAQAQAAPAKPDINSDPQYQAMQLRAQALQAKIQRLQAIEDAIELQQQMQRYVVSFQAKPDPAKADAKAPEVKKDVSR